jgi:hypothetical protein
MSRTILSPNGKRRGMCSCLASAELTGFGGLLPFIPHNYPLFLFH